MILQVIISGTTAPKYHLNNCLMRQQLNDTLFKSLYVMGAIMTNMAAKTLLMEHAACFKEFEYLMHILFTFSFTFIHVLVIIEQL